MKSAAHGRIRVHGLAAATAMTLSLLAAPAFAGRADLSGLQLAGEFDQFIAGLDDGATVGRDLAALNESVRGTTLAASTAGA